MSTPNEGRANPRAGAIAASKLAARRRIRRIVVAIALAIAVVGLVLLGVSAVEQGTDDDPDDEAVTVWFGVLVAGFALTLFTAGLALAGAGVGRLIIGADKRLSTSKLQAVLWTYGVVAALLTLLAMYFAGDGAGLNAVTEGEDGLPEAYLVLLGGPFAAAVAAKAIVTSKVESGDVNKTEGEEQGTIRSRIKEAVSDDDGNADLVDTQYLLFNVVALLFFVVVFLAAPREGLPELPDALVALTGVGALTYVTNKAVQRSAPELTSVTPAVVRPDEALTVRGRNLLVPKKGEDVLTTVGAFEPMTIQIGGREVPDLDSRPASSADGVNEIRQIPVPEGVRGAAKVRVLTFRGIPTNELDLAVESAEILSMSPSTAAPGDRVTLRVRGMGAGDGVVVTVGDREASVELGPNGAIRVLTVTVPAELIAGAHPVLVRGADGAATAAKELTIAAGVRIGSVHPATAKPGEDVHVYGIGFVADPPGQHETVVEADGRPGALKGDPTDTHLVVTLPADLAAPGQTQLVVVNSRAQRSEAFPVPMVT